MDCYLWAGNIPNPGRYGNEPATGSGLDFKTETPPRPTYIQEQATLQEFW
jgi:hypothetical protein